MDESLRARGKKRAYSKTSVERDSKKLRNAGIGDKRLAYMLASENLTLGFFYRRSAQPVLLSTRNPVLEAFLVLW